MSLVQVDSVLGVGAPWERFLCAASPVRMQCVAGYGPGPGVILGCQF